MRPAIGLLVEPDDVDDPYVFDLGRDQVGGGADDVGKRERLLAGQHAHVDAPVGVDFHVAEILDGQPEPVGDGGQVEIHACGQRFHIAAGDEGAEVAEHDTAQDVQS